MQAEFIAKPRRFRLVYQCSVFQLLDTPLGPQSLLPGDFILADCDTDEQIGVKARDLCNGYFPINADANAVMVKAANTVGFQADLEAMERDFETIMGHVSLPLVEEQAHPGPRPEKPLTVSTGQCRNEMLRAGQRLIPRSCPTCGIFARCAKGLTNPQLERADQARAQADQGHGRGGTHYTREEIAKLGLPRAPRTDPLDGVIDYTMPLPPHPEDGQPTLKLVGDDLLPTQFIVGDDELDLERFNGEGGAHAA